METGCIGLWAKATDYILDEWLLDALPTLYQQDEIIYQYNQGLWKRSLKSCTLFSPVWAISDLMNIEIPMDTIKLWDSRSYDNWRIQDEGWYVSMWVDHIVKEYNNSELAKKYWKVAYYSIDLKDNELVKKVLDKRYTICTWFQWNSNYTNDKNKDWVLDWTDFWKATYWHAVNAIRWINTPSRIKDNYYQTAKYNIYDVAHEFSEISCFYDRGYVITKVKEDNLEEIKRLNEIKTECYLLIEHLWKLRHLVNDENFRWILHYTAEKIRKKISDANEELKKYV